MGSKLKLELILTNGVPIREVTPGDIDYNLALWGVSFVSISGGQIRVFFANQSDMEIAQFNTGWDRTRSRWGLEANLGPGHRNGEFSVYTRTMRFSGFQVS